MDINSLERAAGMERQCSKLRMIGLGRLRSQIGDCIMVAFARFARFLDRICLALWASGLWPRITTLKKLIPSSPWIAPSTLAIQGKEGIKFCYLATLACIIRLLG